MPESIYEFEDVIINSDIGDIKFVCDLGKCKGACCTMRSSMGAPIDKKEIPEIESVLSKVLGYLSPRNVDYIKINGFWEEKYDTLMLKSIENKDCVFVYYEHEIAKCAIEKAYREAEIKYIKPISCHLFPIRISDFGGKVLRYESYAECEPALHKGINENKTIAEFCREALERRFGKSWYNRLISEIGK